ncbi:unnamed protein product [Symbiodinium sp. CCMP2592]|nr:unnamed protein product [Symbiodinium sp. CCMP2592]
MSIRDKAHKDKCGIQNELQLSEALCRRALSCDLLQLCTFANMDMWHRHLLSKLSEQPPPYYAKVSMEQLLRCDKAAWVRMSELLTSLKKDDAGNLPMDAALDKLQYDPKIMMHLAPLPGAKWTGDGKGDKGTKRDADGKAKLPHRPNKGAGKGKCPEALADSRLKHNCSKTKKRLCWNFNMQAGCKFAKAGESCKRGLHICMFCEQPHSLLQCPTYKADSLLDEVLSPSAPPHAANHVCMPAQIDPVGPVERPKPASSVLDRIPSVVIDERVFPLPAERQVHASLHPAEQFAQNVLSSGEPVTATCIERPFSLLPSKVDERFGSISGKSFVAGVFRHGGVVGLTNTCRSFPQSVSLAIAWAMTQGEPELSDFTFCSIALNLNVKTEVHRDVNNDDADNLVLPVTTFSGGHIWVQSESGSHVLPVNGSMVPGDLHDVAAALYARKRLRCTMPWTGDRMVLILFSGGDVTAKVKGVPLDSLMFLDVFCGTGGLCASLRQLGMKLSVGFDRHAQRGCKCPVVSLDLTKPGSRAILLDLLQQPHVVACHLSPPVTTSCGGLQGPRSGGLRNATHPEGVPGLQGTDLELVQGANALFALCAEVWHICWSHGVFCSIAHPSRSIMWLSASLRSCQSTPFLSTSLHQCMFGSYRRKATRLLHTVPYLQKLGVTCDGGHDHEPWRSPAQNRMKDGGLPPLLCKTFAQALVDQLVACGARAPACSFANATLSLSLGARVATATQPSGRKIPPLVPEFARTVKLAGPADQLPCTSKTKLVSAWADPSVSEPAL